MTFKCAVCQETFKQAWSDEEAISELNSNYPGFTPDDCSIVCDDCYQLMMTPLVVH